MAKNKNYITLNIIHNGSTYNLIKIKVIFHKNITLFIIVIIIMIMLMYNIIS